VTESAAAVHEVPEHATSPSHEGHATAPAAVRPSGHSIYHLPGSWTDQHGAETSLADLSGRVQVVAMVYTHCTFACPRILARMKALEARLATGSGDEVGFVLVSIDPDRDTPERLARFADDTRLDGERWTLLNGDDADVLALSVLLGVKYRATADGEFSHSNVLTVLDRNGEIAGRVEGLNADVTPVLEAVEDALRRPRTTPGSP
jgi:protein SCO1/2